MLYIRRKECGWNATHTYGFHAAWKRDSSFLSFPDNHDYWKLLGKTVGVATVTGASEGSRAVTQAQFRLAISEVISRHQGKETDAKFLPSSLTSPRCWII